MSETTSMSSSWVSWVRMFDVPEVSKHKNGFTIYKVVSFLYPESCPDAVTKLIVWKRYNDFKKLHKDVKLLHKRLSLQDELPNLPKSVVLFKRFDEETINQRKRGILNFLEYIGSHAALFTSTVFVKFFESSHTPAEHVNSNISAIRADLNLPEQAEIYNSDDDKTISDTDSFTSSNLGSTTQAPLDATSKTNLKKLNSMTSIDSQSSKASECLSVNNADNSLSLLDQHGLEEVPETVQYLMNASMHVDMAIELENDKHYEEAYSAYKTAVDILISYGKEDPDYDRKQMVRYKTEKYLIRAERLYNMYLAPEVKDLHLERQQEHNSHRRNIVKGPLYHLYKYKVIKIISPSGMLVVHSETQQIYYLKVIHKTLHFLNPHYQLILPERVPYMVKLVNHYSTDNAIFLILEYSCGTKLRDLLDNKDSFDAKEDQLLRKIQDQSDNESEMSFSELVNDYVATRDANKCHQHSDEEDFVKVEMPGDKNILDEPLRRLDVPDLISESAMEKDNLAGIMSKTLSEVSSFDSTEEFECRNGILEERVVKWASQLLVALEALHQTGVICRDLTVDNLLIDEGDNLLLTYMCNIKELCDLYSKGINLNLAPEIYSFEEITEAADWWSFGAILYELLVGMPLNKVHSNGISSYTHIIVPKYVSIEGKSLLKQLLICESEDRLGSKINGVQHLKSHPFFRSVCWDAMEA